VTGLEALTRSIREFGGILNVDPQIAERAAAEARLAAAAAADAAAAAAFADAAAAEARLADAAAAAAAAVLDLDPATARGNGLQVTSPRRADKFATSHCFVFSRGSFTSGTGVHTWLVQCVPWLHAGEPGEFWIFLGVASDRTLRYEHPSSATGTLWGISVCANGNYWTVAGPAGMISGGAAGPTNAKVAPGDTVTVSLDSTTGTLTLANARLGWQYVMRGLPVAEVAWTPAFDPYDCSFLLI
jgi:hypothetical protein